MYSKEEKANFFTHAIGLTLAIAGSVALLESAMEDADNWRRISFFVYGASLVFMFASSTFYHGSTDFRYKKILQIIDHIAIYLLIAGTYTPFLVVPLRGGWGWTLLAIIWTLAIAGSILKFQYTGKYNRISTAVYLGMGWLAVVAVKPMITLVPLASLLWLLAGGLFYSVGVFFYLRASWRYHHAVWHTFVLAGSACHFISISEYL
jgi:hemolysin III